MMKRLKTIQFVIKLILELEPKVLIYRGIYTLLFTVELFLTMYLPSIIVTLITSNYSLEQAITRTVIILLVVLIMRVLNHLLDVYAKVYENDFSRVMTAEIGEKLTHASFEQIENPEFITMKDQALFPITNLSVMFHLFQIIPTLIQSFVVLVSVLLILVYKSPILLCLTLISAFLTYFFSKVMIKFEVEEQQDSIKLNKQYLYFLRTMRNAEIAKDVRIYQMQPFFSKKLKELFNQYVIDIKKLYQSREYRNLVNQVISTLLMISMYIYLLYEFMNSNIDLATFVLLVNATTNFNSQINVFLNQVLHLNQQLVYLEPLIDFYDLIEEDKKGGSKILDNEISSIEFENVVFSYPNTDKQVLKNCSFKLDSNQSLSIVGLNGSGKTTIIKLLAKLYRPQEGRILVNGIDINEYEDDSYLNELSIIFQDFKTFQYSIKENIIFDFKEDKKKLEKAIRDSELEKELSKFKNGIDTTLVRRDGENASVTLSKGQEQKLAIARSIYLDGSLLILDEPTASLDPIAEEEVYKHFQEITKGKLSVFISHRLSSCRFADSIIYIEDGQVKEQGTHKQLLKQKGSYAGLFNLQASKYKRTESN